MSRKTLAQTIGSAQAKAVQEALKPLLRKHGVHAVEERIGKPCRFFSNVRQRGTMKVRDYLAVCAVLEVDPGEFIASAIAGEINSEIRQPRIVSAAWEQIELDGPGLGDERLSALDTQVYENPSKPVLSSHPSFRRHDPMRCLGFSACMAQRCESNRILTVPRSYLGKR